MSSPNPTAAPSRAKLFTQSDLRELREALFKLELATLRQLIDDGLNTGQIGLVADIARAIEAVEQLQPGARER
jgi:hypothetical protein